MSGSFSAGFAEGFASTIKEGVDWRRERKANLIDENMKIARTLGLTKIKEREARKNITYDVAKKFREFGLTDKEILAIAQGHDINSLYAGISAENTRREQEGTALITREDILKTISFSEEMIPPSMSLEEGINKMFGLQTDYLKQQPNPKSDIAKDKSIFRAMFEIAPEDRAQKFIESASVAGIPVEVLLDAAYDSGAKRTVVPGVEAKGTWALAASNVDRVEARQAFNDIAERINKMNMINYGYQEGHIQWSDPADAAKVSPVADKAVELFVKLREKMPFVDALTYVKTIVNNNKGDLESLNTALMKELGQSVEPKPEADTDETKVSDAMEDLGIKGKDEPESKSEYKNPDILKALDDTDVDEVVDKSQLEDYHDTTFEADRSPKQRSRRTEKLILKRAEEVFSKEELLDLKNTTKNREEYISLLSKLLDELANKSSE